jgi:dTDP-4-amino-4,6-dideoxygalactose transaminase
LGIRQLGKLEENLRRRREIASRYSQAFKQLPGIIVPGLRSDANPAWHLYPVQVDPKKLSANRARVFSALRGENIGVNVHYIPVHQHPYYRDRFGYKAGDFPVAEGAYERLISLPMFHGMTDGDIDDVIRAVTKIALHFAK